MATNYPNLYVVIRKLEHFEIKATSPWTITPSGTDYHCPTTEQFKMRGTRVDVVNIPQQAYCHIAHPSLKRYACDGLDLEEYLLQLTQWDIPKL